MVENVGWDEDLERDGIATIVWIRIDMMVLIIEIER